MTVELNYLTWPKIAERVELSDWFQLAEQQKLDVLRGEVIDIKRILKYVLGATGVVGALVGSLSTVVVEAVVRHIWP